MNDLIPLAERARPKSLKDFVGQEHLLADGKILRSVIESDNLTSIILWGPPGTGKTTIARIIAKNTKSHFVEFSAVTSGVADVRRIVKEAQEDLRLGQKTILFADEIHRFNNAQQDAFLPHIENGTIILIGATTENPGFEINSALLSRSRLFKLEPLEDKDIKKILKNVLKDKTHGLGDQKLQIDTKSLDYIASFANGDARLALNILEVIASEVKGDTIVLDFVKQAIAFKNLRWDKGGDNHYDVISAFIKSMRGSDPDAAVHYLARMISSGEDAKFIARRMVLFASEDIGNADPHSLILAQSTADAVNFIGMPESQLILSQCVLYLASAPKSNASKMAILEALDDIGSKRLDPVPLHLRNAPTKLAKSLGHGKDYKYPHDYKENWVKEDYLPENLIGTKYYKPTENGFEKKIKDKLDKLKKD